MHNTLAFTHSLTLLPRSGSRTFIKSRVLAGRTLGNRNQISCTASYYNCSAEPLRPTKLKTERKRNESESDSELNMAIVRFLALANLKLFVNATNMP